MMTIAENAEATTPPVSRWEDYVDIYYSPAQVYERRRDAGWVHPFIFVVAVSVALYYLMLPANGRIIELAMTQSNPDAAAMPEGMLRITRILGGVFLPFNYAILLGFWGVLLWGISRLAEISIGFRQALVVVVYASLVLPIQSLVTAGLVLLGGDDLRFPQSVSLGALRFTGDDLSGVMTAVLSRVDPFAIWIAVLWGVGLYVIGRTTKGRAALAAGLAWLLAAVPSMLMALLRGTPAA